MVVTRFRVTPSWYNRVMFTCDVCKQPQPAGSTPHRLVTAYRTVTYVRSGGQQFVGNEIIKEVNACKTCEVQTPVVMESAKEVFQDTRKKKFIAKDDRDRNDRERSDR